jgi:ubiquinone/menaquinone biosynthesis C-methylase UbiE
MRDPVPMDGLPEEPPPSPESFGDLYKLLGSSPTYRQILADVHGQIYGLQLSVAGPMEVRLLANRAGLAPGQRVADLACGMGGSTVHLAAEYGCAMIAVDWSRQALALCRQSAAAVGVAEHMRFLVGDITRPVFADEALHAVVSIDGFYFGVDLPWLYREVFRILRPGGRFAFYFNIPSQAVVDASSASRRAHRESHRIDHQAVLHQAGFVQVRAEERTFNEQRLLNRFLAAYTTRFDALSAEIGADLATDLREEIAQTLVMTEHGQWPR